MEINENTKVKDLHILEPERVMQIALQCSPRANNPTNVLFLLGFTARINLFCCPENSAVYNASIDEYFEFSLGAAAEAMNEAFFDEIHKLKEIVKNAGL